MPDNGEIHHIQGMERRKIRGLDFVRPAGWQGKPLPEHFWLVDGLIPAGSVTMITGDGGLGKSLLLLQLMAACATGKSWLGYPTSAVKAMGIFCEDDEEEIHRRLYRITQAYGIDFKDFNDDLLVHSRVAYDNSLMSYKTEWRRDGKFGESEKLETVEQTQLWLSIMNAAIDFDAKLVVLDSLHDLFTGNENNRTHARQFIGMLRELALEINGAVVLCAHPSVAGMQTGTGSAGSTAWNNAVRSRLYLTRPRQGADEEPDYDARVLKTMKANYGNSGGEIKLRWQDGVFINESIIPQPGGTVHNLEQRRLERRFLDALMVLVNRKQGVSPKRRATNYAPRIMCRMPEMKGVSKDEIERILEDLWARNIIAECVIGKGPDRHDIVGLAPTEQAEGGQE